MNSRGFSLGLTISSIPVLYVWLQGGNREADQRKCGYGVQKIQGVHGLDTCSSRGKRVRCYLVLALDWWFVLIPFGLCGYRGVIEMLIKKNANVEAKNNNGFTALMIASQWGKEYVISFLFWVFS